jgi:ABC-type nitrate/sulfonate/bicarbonate transport system substrate-binding protein
MTILCCAVLPSTRTERPTESRRTVTELELKTVTRTQGCNEDLKNGAVVPHGFRFSFEEVPVLVKAFRRMVRATEFDVSEMALTTYLVAKAHEAAFTAIPTFLVRGFHHSATQVLVGSDVRSPKELEGRRVGVNRGYTVTTGVWARAILQDQYGVDLSSITWVASGDEHVSEYQPPFNVVASDGLALEDQLRRGDLAAVVGANIDAPDVVPLIPDAEEAGRRALAECGLYPINHLVVVKDEVLQKHPCIAVDIFNAFGRAKQRYVARLSAGILTNPDKTDRMYEDVLTATGRDPLPYGIEPNRHTLEHLIRSAVDQKILVRPFPEVEELFAQDTRQLTA